MSSSLTPHQPHEATVDTESDETLNPIDLLVALGDSKWLLAATTALATAAGLAFALSQPDRYTAKTVIVPPQQTQSAAAALASLGALAGGGGGGGGIGSKSPDEMYAAFLRGERLRARMVERFGLMQRYGATRPSDARTSLGGASTVSIDRKSGLITVAVVDHDPAFAAQLANGFYEELKVMLASLAVSEAQQRRVFFEQQVTKARDQLAAAEIRFKTAQRDSGLMATQALADTSVKASVELRTQIASREVQLQALRGTYATAQNPDVLRLSSELAALRAQLRRVEQGRGDAAADDPAVTTAGRLDPGQAAVKAFREFKTQEAVFEGLVRQLELARLDESREGPVLQQAEPAVAPDRKSGPGRRNMVLLAAAAGLALGLVWALARHWWRQRRAMPGTQEQLDRLRGAWRLRT